MAASVPGADLPPEARSRRESYLQALGRLQDQYTTRLRLIRADYADRLTAEYQAAIKVGDKTVVDPIIREMSRFGRRRHWTLGRKDKPPPPALKSPFDVARGQAANLAQANSAARKRLAAAYEAQLKSVVVALTKAGKLEEAVRVQAELKGIPELKAPASSGVPLVAGRRPRTMTAKELEKMLDRTRWRLRWTGGTIPIRTEFVDFDFGRIYRGLSTQGSVETLKYTIKKDLTLVTDEKHYKLIRFDPSFTMFLLEQPRSGRYRMGYRVGALETTGGADKLAEGLLLYYPLDDVDVTTEDFSPNRNKGRARYTATVHYGKKRNAYRFDGRTSEIQVTGDIHPDAYRAFSVSVWLKVHHEVRGAAIFSWDEKAKHGGVYLRLVKGRFEYRLGSGSGKHASGARPKYKLKTWHHVVLTHDRIAGNVFYLDGARVDSMTAAPLKGSSKKLIIGSGVGKKKGTRTHFAGLIDEFAVYERALTPADVDALYKGKTIVSIAGAGAGKEAPKE
jgi:hypothetical protein